MKVDVLMFDTISKVFDKYDEKVIENRKIAIENPNKIKNYKPKYQDAMIKLCDVCRESLERNVMLAHFSLRAIKVLEQTEDPEISDVVKFAISACEQQVFDRNPSFYDNERCSDYALVQQKLLKENPDGDYRYSTYVKTHEQPKFTEQEMNLANWLGYKLKTPLI